MFDIDKIFISGMNMKLNKKSDGTWEGITNFEEGSKKQIQNRLIQNYICVLRDKDTFHIAQRSIDKDTEMLKDVLKDIEEGKDTSNEVMPYDFYCLRAHTIAKNDFLTGKNGIGPFALNNNSQVLTMLYDVSFKEGSIMDKLEHASLSRSSDDDNQSILSWISALINAHVDIAKDPYISRLNVNPMTYNLTNLLIRTGYGKRTFYFLTQPVMKQMAAKYQQAQGKFMQEEGKSSWQIRNEAKREAAKAICGEEVLEDIEMLFFDMEGKVTDWGIEMAKKCLNDPDRIFRLMSKGDEKISKSGAYGYTFEQLQAIVYCTDKMLERPAEDISNLVKYSKIDTKKQGNNISEQIAYAKGVAKTFGDELLLERLFGVNISRMYSESASSPFEPIGIRNMYRDSFIQNKTLAAIGTFFNIVKGHLIEATPGFNNIVDKLSNMLHVEGATSIKKLSDAVLGKLKAEIINQYAKDNGIDIPGLVSGDNTIYDRLNILKCKMSQNPQNYEGFVDQSGNITNVLLKLLSPDNIWEYNHNSHLHSAKDKYENLKFVRLFNAIDVTNAQTNYIIEGWDELLNCDNEELRQFARDLCVYAYVTSEDKQGRTKIFQFVPNSFRKECGWDKGIKDIITSLNNGGDQHMLTAEFVDDIVLNNTDDYTFAPTVKIEDKESKTQWIQSKVNRFFTDVDESTYVPEYPIALTVSPETPIPDEELKPYIKVKRSKSADGSNRSYTVYKLVHAIKGSTKDTSIPIYIKVNPRGYHIKGGFDFYEYSNDRSDSSIVRTDYEYFPSVSILRSFKNYLEKNADNLKEFERVYGETMKTITNRLSLQNNLRINMWELDDNPYMQSETWSNPKDNVQSRTFYVPESKETEQPAQQPEQQPEQQPQKSDLAQALEDYQKNWNDLSKTNKEGLNEEFAKKTTVKLGSESVTKSSLEVLDDIIANTNNESYRKVAQWLKNYVQKHNVTIEFSGSTGNNKIGVTRIYKKKDGTIDKVIIINTNNLEYKLHPEETLLHEIVHSVSNVAVKLWKESTEAKDINAYISYVKEQIEKVDSSIDVQGLESPEEFIAEFWANPLFLNILRNIPPMEQKEFNNIFEELIHRIIQAINKFLGTTPSNALEQFKPIAKGILDIESVISYSNKSIWERLKKFKTTSEDYLTDDMGIVGYLPSHGWEPELTQQHFAEWLTNYINEVIATPAEVSEIVKFVKNKKTTQRGNPTYGILIVNPKFKQHIKNLLNGEWAGDEFFKGDNAGKYIYVSGDRIRIKGAELGWNQVGHLLFPNDTISDYQIGRKRKEEMFKVLSNKLSFKNKPYLTRLTIARIEKLGEESKQGGDPKAEKAALYWVLKDGLRLPDDTDVFMQAMYIINKKGLDYTKFKSPAHVVDEFAEVLEERKVNPDDIKEFKNKRTYNNGITIYDVDDNFTGLLAVRKAIDDNFGHDANPWCLAARTVIDDYGYDAEYEAFQSVELSKDLIRGYNYMLENIDAIIRGDFDYKQLLDITNHALAKDRLRFVSEYGGVVYYRIDGDFDPQLSDEYGHYEDLNNLEAIIKDSIDFEQGNIKYYDSYVRNLRRLGDLDKAQQMWHHYNAIPKRIAFLNGKLIAFSANSTPEILWWDRMDVPHEGIPMKHVDNKNMDDPELYGPFGLAWEKEQPESTKLFYPKDIASTYYWSPSPSDDAERDDFERTIAELGLDEISIEDYDAVQIWFAEEQQQLLDDLQKNGEELLRNCGY